jgi:hypothetical protein
MAQEKVRIELRFDADVAEKVKELADEVGVSVNQLMQGIARWTTQTARLGEPKYNRAGKVVVDWTQEGCVWWGEPSTRQQPPEVPEEEATYSKGHICGALDFTERRVVKRVD